MIGCVPAALLSHPMVSWASVFNDGFEAPSLNAFWTVSLQQHYDIVLTTTPTHSGSQALALTSLPSPSEDGAAVIEHSWATPQTGTSSIWFYDHAPSVGDSYAGFYIDSSSSSLAQGLSIRDWDASFYHDNAGQTAIPRAQGWHELKFVVAGSGASAFIDGALVSTVAAMDSFDRIQVWGGQWYPKANSTYVFDDFTVSSIPEPGMTTMAFVFALCGLGCAVRRHRE